MEKEFTEEDVRDICNTTISFLNGAGTNYPLSEKEYLDLFISKVRKKNVKTTGKTIKSRD